MPPRRRLTPEQRRDALLDVGDEVFRESSVDDVSMQQIADRAGVTRALLYHYFATKAELFGGVWARAHERLRAASTTLGPSTPPATVRDWVERRLRVYLDFYAANLPLVIIANRSSISSDPAVRRPIDASFAELSRTIMDAAGAAPDVRPRAEVGFSGWLAFVRETSVATYLDARITPDENVALCMRMFDTALGGYLDLTAPPP